MEHTMNEYIQRQPSVLTEMLQNRAALAAPFVEFFTRTRPDRLYLVGSGTSHNAAAAASAFLTSLLQIEVTPVIPSRLPALFGRRPAVVFLSQGGSSTNMLAAMEQLARYPAIAITGEADCEIGQRSRLHMQIGCGEELAGPKTLGYTASVLCLYLCGLEAAKGRTLSLQRYGEEVAALETAFSQMPENLCRCRRWLCRNQEALLAADRFLFVGQGTAAFAAQEAALKLLETVRLPAMGYEFEEYLHGPLLVAGRTLAGFLFLTQDAGLRPRMEGLARCQAAECPAFFAVSGQPVDGVPTLELLQSGKSLTEVFEFIVPAQIVAANIPALKGVSEHCRIEEQFTKTWQTKYAGGR